MFPGLRSLGQKMIAIADTAPGPKATTATHAGAIVDDGTAFAWTLSVDGLQVPPSSVGTRRCRKFRGDGTLKPVCVDANVFDALVDEFVRHQVPWFKNAACHGTGLALPIVAGMWAMALLSMIVEGRGRIPQARLQRYATQFRRNLDPFRWSIAERAGRWALLFHATGDAAKADALIPSTDVIGEWAAYDGAALHLHGSDVWKGIPWCLPCEGRVFMFLDSDDERSAWLEPLVSTFDDALGFCWISPRSTYP